MLKKFKGIISLLLCFVLLTGTVAVGDEGFADFFAFIYEVISIHASAETYDVFTYEINDGEATITGCDSSASGEIIILEYLTK